MINYNKQESIGFLLNRTSRALSNLFNKKLLEKGYMLKVDHFMLLNRIYETQKLSQQQLAELICLDKTTVTRHLDVLEKENLIERISDKEDRRNKLIVLSTKGIELLTEIHSGIKVEILEQIAKSFSDQEENELKRLLNKLYTNIEI